jgi:16S rRNA (adenine1518-N6/adenine1519-N6)-dimethyltransferase
VSSPRPPGRGDALRILAEAGIELKRSLGQHLVVDPNTVERIARLARIGPGDHVLEIGPGAGSLTLALAATGAEVLAVEIDRRLAALARTVVGERARIVEGDALEVDFSQLLLGASPWVLVANLPYNVAATIVLRLLELVPEVARMLVMVQREVGERLVSQPGTRAYGAVTVRVAYFATARLAGRVSPEVFHPRPKVDSLLVELARRASPAVDARLASYGEILELVRAGFAGRRKMLRRSLAGLVPPEAFSAAGIDPTDRAERLDVLDWGKLAACRRSLTSGRSPS